MHLKKPQNCMGMKQFHLIQFVINRNHKHTKIRLKIVEQKEFLIKTHSHTHTQSNQTSLTIAF